MSYDAPPPAGYNAPPPGGYNSNPATPSYGGGQEHPKSTTILVLGVLGLICCQLLAPFAWIMGNTALKEVQQSNGALVEGTSLKVGRILGIVGCALWVVSAVFFVVLLASGAFNASSELTYN